MEAFDFGVFIHRSALVYNWGGWVSFLGDMDMVEGNWRSEDEKKMVELLKLFVERDGSTSKVFFLLIYFSCNTSFNGDCVCVLLLPL